MAVPHHAPGSEGWRFGGIVRGGPNQHCIPVHDAGSLPARAPKLQLCFEDDEPLTVTEVSQKTVKLRIPEGSRLVDSFRDLDDFALNAAERKSMEVFKKPFQKSQLQLLQRPCLEGRALELKIGDDTRVWRLLDADAGAATQRFCDATLEDVEAGSAVWPCVEVNALFFLPRCFGLVLSASDLLLIPAAKTRAFPFSSRAHTFVHAADESLSPLQDGGGGETCL